MILATTPLGIEYPTEGDQVTPLGAQFQTLAETADTAIEGSKARPWRSFGNTLGQNVAGNNAIVTIVGWVGVNGDPGDGIGIAYTNGVITVGENGLYACYLKLSFASHAGGTMRCRITPSAGEAATGGTQDDAAFATISAEWQGVLNAGQTLTIEGINSTVGSIPLLTNAGYNQLLVAQRFPIA